MAAYDETNIFAKILRGEIPCKKVHEDNFCLAFHDINPQAPVHVLVIPKAPYVDFDSFAAEAPADLVAGYMAGIGKTVRKLGLQGDGFRILANNGVNGGQEVPHLHFHIFGGKPLGRMISA